ncbi:transcription factor C6 [Dipodascopsis uninucleata]
MENSMDRSENLPEANSHVPEYVVVSKGRACVECKKHKIKCEMRPNSISCVRCRKKRLKCVNSNEIRRLLDEGEIWRTEYSSQLIQLRSAVSTLLRANNLPDILSFPVKAEQNDLDLPESNAVDKRLSDTSMQDETPLAEMPLSAPSTSMTENGQQANTNREAGMDQVKELEPELVDAPMNSVYEVTKLETLKGYSKGDGVSTKSCLEEDFISAGLLGLEEAEMLFSFFYRTMNQFLWGGIALPYNDLESVRRASSILTTAILSVAALNLPNSNKAFLNCYNEYIRLTFTVTLSRNHSLDELRALIIGAFWLPDLSWKLSGLAIRVATEMDVHKSVRRLIVNGDENEFERAKIWYLIYILEHQISIAYGRPPSIYEDFSVQNYNDFLKYRGVTQSDLRMIAQVALYKILARAYKRFGLDTDQCLSEEDLNDLRLFNLELDQWRIVWKPKLEDSPYVGSYPAKGVIWHHHFGKFQLNGLAFRGLPPNGPVSTDRRELSNIAIASAVATLHITFEEEDLRKAISGVPIYTHAMVVFCTVFLLKVAWKWNRSSLNIDRTQVLSLVDNVVSLLSSERVNEKHIIHHSAMGLKAMLLKLKEKDRSSESPSSEQLRQIDLLTGDLSFGGFGFDENWTAFSMSTYDYFM